MRTELEKENLSHLIRWPTPENVHLTVRFLGDTTPEQRLLLATELSQVATIHAPFSLQLSGLGAFPNPRKPAVLWMGIDGQIESLARFQQSVEDAAVASGFQREQRPYRPHLTIGRISRRATHYDLRTISRILARRMSESTGTSEAATIFLVEDFVHMRSELTSTGAHYTPMRQFRFHDVD